jgi:hypothetical protein
MIDVWMNRLREAMVNLSVILSKFDQCYVWLWFKCLQAAAIGYIPMIGGPA